MSEDYSFSATSARNNVRKVLWKASACSHDISLNQVKMKMQSDIVNSFENLIVDETSAIKNDQNRKMNVTKIL